MQQDTKHKFHLVSDLHVDFYSDKGKALFRDWKNPDNIPTLVIAGDMAEQAWWMNKAVHRLPSLVEKYETVLFVAGNHEFYRAASLRAGLKLIQSVTSSIPNFHVLHRETHTDTQGLVFAGCSLWFDESPLSRLFEPQMADFRYIGNRDSFRTDVAKENSADQEWIRNFDVDASPDVIITHHLPTRQCIHESYHNDPLNDFYVTEMQDVFFSPALRNTAIWCFGHSHIPCQLPIKGEDGITDLVCLSNPRGYEGEVAKNFRPLTVTLGA